MKLSVAHKDQPHKANQWPPIEHSLRYILSFKPYEFSFVKGIDTLLKANAIFDSAQSLVNGDIILRSNINFRAKFHDIQNIEGVHEGRVEVFTNMPGIAGINNLLPNIYVEKHILYQEDSIRNTIIDFFDIFNHRFNVIRYNFYKRYVPYCYSSDLKESLVGKILLSLSGLAEHESNESSKQIPEQFQLSCQNLLWKNTRGAKPLEAMLSGFFDVPVAVKQFAGGYLKAREQDRTRIGPKFGRFNKLASDSILGCKVWDESKGIEVHVGPLAFKQYLKFLPKISKKDDEYSPLTKMKKIIKSYAPFGISVKIFIHLESDEVTGTILGDTKRVSNDAFIKGFNSLEKIFITDL